MYRIDHDQQEIPIENIFHKKYNINPSVRTIFNKKTAIAFKPEILKMFENDEHETLIRISRTYKDEHVILHKNKKIIYHIHGSSYESSENKFIKYTLCIFYIIVEYDFVDNLVETLLTNKSIHFKPKRVKDETNLYCIYKSHSGLSLQKNTKKIKNIDIGLNYNDDICNSYKNICDHLKNDKINNKGLILIHGKPGTGKTVLIKQMSKDINKKFIIIPPTFIPSISSPDFLSFLLNHQNSVLVLEDSEEYLIERGTNNNGSSVSSILNITDGVLSDFLNIKVIATFNSEISKLDKALLRKGRLMDKLEINELTIEKTNNLLKHLNVDYISNDSMTLTDIYNLKDKSFDKNNQKKIGF
jgi:ATP-dependent Zn protease